MTLKKTRVCAWCGKANMDKHHFHALYCFACSPKANRRHGAYEAQKAVHAEIRAGRMKKASEYKCVDCGKQALDWDHRDYNKPLEVEPVCRSCNKKRGPAIPVGIGLYTPMQSKFVKPNIGHFATRLDVLANHPNSQKSTA